MTIYEFYTAYVITGKAQLLTSINLHALKTYLNTTALCIEFKSSIGGTAYEIPFDVSINSLPLYGIKISLVVDPIFITASMLTDVISIPVPIPDDLPF